MKPSLAQIPRRMLCALFLLGGSPALRAAEPPSAHFDLGHWKLTLPRAVDRSRDRHPEEIPPGKLTTGYFHPDFFHTGPDGTMVFWCPVSGTRTENTDYPRTELREMIDPSDDNVCWSAFGTHVLDARLRVLEVPSSQKVVIGQIHSYSGKAPPLIKLQYFKGRIEALIKSSPAKGKDIKLRFPEIGLNEDFEFQIQLQDGILKITVLDTVREVNILENDPEWGHQTFYFKAGIYPQDNEGPDSEGARAAFSHLKVSHPDNTALNSSQK